MLFFDRWTRNKRMVKNIFAVIFIILRSLIIIINDKFSFEDVYSIYIIYSSFFFLDLFEGSVVHLFVSEFSRFIYSLFVLYTTF